MGCGGSWKVWFCLGEEERERGEWFIVWKRLVIVKLGYYVEFAYPAKNAFSC